MPIFAAMKSVQLFLLLLFLGVLSAVGQRRIVVADVETLLPVGGVNVQANDVTAVTDSMGHITVADTCRTLVFSHVNYESRIVNLEEVRDTVFLISKLLSISGVVVFGKARYDDSVKELQERLRMNITEAQLAAANPNSGVNLFALIKYLIPKSWRKKRETHRQRHDRILEDY